MTTKQQQNNSTVTCVPGMAVYDVIANAVGRVADPQAYPGECLGAADALVVPLAGSEPAWQAEPGALRPATAAEIEAALRRATADEIKAAR